MDRTAIDRTAMDRNVEGQLVMFYERRKGFS
jgi:hypothetical protein